MDKVLLWEYVVSQWGVMYKNSSLKLQRLVSVVTLFLQGLDSYLRLTCGGKCFCKITQYSRAVNLVCSLTVDKTGGCAGQLSIAELPTYRSESFSVILKVISGRKGNGGQLSVYLFCIGYIHKCHQWSLFGDS